jgi:hypothetical protein
MHPASSMKNEMMCNASLIAPLLVLGRISVLPNRQWVVWFAQVFPKLRNKLNVQMNRVILVLEYINTPSMHGGDWRRYCLVINRKYITNE